MLIKNIQLKVKQGQKLSTRKISKGCHQIRRAKSIQKIKQPLFYKKVTLNQLTNQYARKNLAQKTFCDLQ